MCTAWLEPSGTLVVSTSTQGSFVTRRELARAFDLPLERVRVIAEPLGGAFGGKFALVEPLAVGRGAGASSSRAPRAHAERGLRRHQPGLGAGHAPQGRRPRRRDVHGDRGANDRRPRHQCRLGRRGGDVAAGRRSVPLAGPRPARLRRSDEPLHVRRLPRSRRADRGVRARVAPRRAGADARPRPDRAAAEERRRRGRRRRQRQPVSDHRRRRGPRAASRAPAVGAARLAAGGRRRRHGRRPSGPARWSPPRPSAGSTPTAR